MQIKKLCKNNALLVFILQVTCFGIIVGSLSVLGCASSSYLGSPSSFDSYYKKGSFVVPEVSAIQRAGQTREYLKPFKEVYDASLDILSQYQGILAMNSTGSQQSMLVLKAREYQCTPENIRRIVTYGSFFEQWLAIAIIKKPDLDITEVSVAVFEPTGNLVNNETAAQLLFSQIQIQLYNRIQWRDKFLYEEESPFKRQSKAGGETSPVSNYESYPYKELEQVLGAWISKSMREELFTIYCPDVTSWLEEIVDQLKKAAGVPDLKTRVTVIPANGLNAFALPSGDIFVSSGLLDSLDTSDQVAAVLAHELDHLIHHDTITRLKTRQVGIGAAAGLRTTTALADTALGIFSSVNPAGPIVGALWDIGRGAGRHLAEQGAQHLETALVSNFTADTELRADENGIKMLNAAGFDPKENIAMLHTLQKYKDKALNKNEVVMFNLVNKKPGIDERIKNLNIILKGIER